MNSKWSQKATGFQYDGPQIRSFVARRGAQMAPVEFFRGRKPGGFSPFYDCPWQDEAPRPGEPPPPRGNFFCLPFGAGGLDENGRVFSCHGDAVGTDWEWESTRDTPFGDALLLKLSPRDVGGSLRRFMAADDENGVLYETTTVSGVEGRYPIGYHPNLKVPTQGRAYLSTAPFELGQVAPRREEQFEPLEYYYLKRSATFTDLSAVPALVGPPSNCTIFPRAEGFVDIVALYRSPAAGITWNVLAFPGEGFLWFSLKQASQFPATLLWMENKGRYHSPWNGRTQVLGFEDSCSYFAADTACQQGKNPISMQGYRTAFEFKKDETVSFPFIEGVIPTSNRFTKVAAMSLADGRVEFRSVEGEAVGTRVNSDFWTFGL